MTVVSISCLRFFFSACLLQVKLGQPGYKERYYAEKFDVEEPKSIDDIKKDVVSFLFFYKQLDCGDIFSHFKWF